MADNTTDKEALKAQKEAEKAAEKAKKERIKQSKPKKEGSVWSRAGKGIKKYFKDFAGTCKKIVWPTGKQVAKNSGVTIVAIVLIGLIVFAFDWGLTHLFDLAEEGVGQLGAAISEDVDASATDGSETDGDTAETDEEAADTTTADDSAADTTADDATAAE